MMQIQYKKTQYKKRLIVLIKELKVREVNAMYSNSRYSVEELLNPTLQRYQDIDINNQIICIMNMHIHFFKYIIKRDNSFFIYGRPEFMTNDTYKYILNLNGLMLLNVIDRTEELCNIAIENNGLALQFVENSTYEMCKKAVLSNGLALEFVKDEFKTQELYYLAINNDCDALKFVEDQTEELCIFSVKINGSALRYVKNQTQQICDVASSNIEHNVGVLELMKDEFKTYNNCKILLTNSLCNSIKDVPPALITYELCLLAVKNSHHDLKYVPQEYKTEIICLNAVKGYWSALEHIENQTEEMCLIALSGGRNRCWQSLQFMHEQTDKVCREAIEQVDIYPELMSLIRNQTEELCKLAVENNLLTLRYIREPTEAIYLHAIEHHGGKTLTYIDNQTDYICRIAIDRDVYAMQYIDIQTDELCRYAIEKNYEALKHIKNHTKELCRYAIEIDYRALKYVKLQTDDICEYAISINADAYQYINGNGICFKLKHLKQTIDVDFNSNFDKDYYEYICPILKEDTSKEGFIIRPHNNNEGSLCRPNSVLCEETIIELFNGDDLQNDGWNDDDNNNNNNNNDNKCYICRKVLQFNDVIYMKFE